jgi:hypothetical protein
MLSGVVPKSVRIQRPRRGWTVSEVTYPPKKEAFDASPWNEVIGTVNERTCFAYSGQFCARAAGEEDATKNEVWRYLARITSFSIDFDPSDEGFGSKVESFTDEEVELTKGLIALVEDAELKSRMADIIWAKQRKGNFACVGIAVEAYLESALGLESQNDGFYCVTRIERAFNLAFAVNNEALGLRVIGHIKDVLDRCNSEEPYFLFARLMPLLLQRREGDPAKYAPLAQTLAERAAASKRFHFAHEFWTLKSRWHALAGDEDAARQAAISAAETHVDEAESRLEQTAAPYLHAAIHLEAAIKALRRIPDTQERVKEIHLRLLDYQQRSMKELLHFEADAIDTNEVEKRSRQAVEGKSFPEALLTLSVMLRIQSKAQARNDAEEEGRKFPLASLFPETHLNAMGRTVARSSSIRAKAADDAEAAVSAIMYSRAQYYWRSSVQGAIEPARLQILEEHAPTVRDFFGLVTESPFVPNGRERLYARGLHAGLVGDFETATHFLIPQLEHSIRGLLYTSGAIASGLDPDGIQHEFDLNKTLKESKHASTLVKILGEDALFNLRAVFVEPYGANLRNEMAHGLMDPNDFYTPAACYGWWLILRLCCVPVLHRLNAAKAEAPPPDAPDD